MIEEFDDYETPTTHVLAGFCLLMALAARSDENGVTKVPTDEHGEDDIVVLTQWANEYLMANKPLLEEECNILRELGTKCELSEAELNGMMSLAEDGIGILDIRMISLNAPIEPNYPPNS